LVDDALINGEVEVWVPELPLPENENILAETGQALIRGC
jgi:hypothetical protein